MSDVAANHRKHIYGQGLRDGLGLGMGSWV